MKTNDLIPGQDRDLPATARVERHRSAEIEMSRALAESKTLAEAATHVLRGLGESVGCELAELWQLRLDRRAAVRIGAWTAQQVAAAPEVDKVELIESADQIWRSGMPAWCPDIEVDPTLSALAGRTPSDLRAALVWPIGMYVPLGGLLFLGREIAEPDARLQRLLEYSAGQIAHFMERARVEVGLRASDERLRTAIHAAPVALFEHALRQSEERLRYVTMATREAIYDWDVENGSVWWNETYQAMFSPSPSAGSGESWWREHIHPDDRQSVIDSITEAFRDRSSSWNRDYRLLRREGRYANVSDRGYILYDRKGQPTRMIGAISDVSERTLAEALREGQSRVLEVIARDAPVDDILVMLCHVIEAQSDGLLCSVLMLDEDGVYVRHGAAPSLPPTYVKALNGAAIGPKRGSCGTAMYYNRPVIVTDVLVDPLWDDHRELALQHGFRACWSIPIADHAGRVLGSFAMYYNQPRSPTRAEMDLIELAARLGGIALERKRASDQLHASLQEKEILLKEIHHRVKNNLQIVSSLLALQAERLEDKQVLAAFTESQNRVSTMALVHEALYRSGDLARVRFATHVESLCAHLLRSYDVSGRIQLQVEVSDVGLDLDLAIPCGLIINELVSNALKHAFPDQRTGRVLVRFRAATEGGHELTVADNGVGLPHGTEPSRSDTLGMQLVTDFTEQLGGTCTIDRDGGTAFTVRFAGPQRKSPA